MSESRKRRTPMADIMANGQANELAPALAPDASNEQVKACIREKAIEALNNAERLNREEWQIVGLMGSPGAKEQD